MSNRNKKLEKKFLTKGIASDKLIFADNEI